MEKKQYIAPSIQVVDLDTDIVMAGINTSRGVDPAEADAPVRRGDSHTDWDAYEGGW